MTEEEAIKICKNIIRAINGETCYFNYSKEQDKEAIETLLDLYYKQKEDIMYFRTDIQDLADDVEFWQNRCDNSIDKDEILKALGYEENDEEYKRIYNKEELILSLIHTINTECDRLEDIEDQKVEVAVAFIEERRDKYWQEKINDKIKELEEYQKQHKEGNWSDIPIEDYDFDKINLLKELLEE